MNTVTESPLKNGLCRRRNAVVDRCLEKILEDDLRTPVATALQWALNKKNSWQMWCDFSSCQLVYGVNPNIALIMTVMERITINSSFAN